MEGKPVDWESASDIGELRHEYSASNRSASNLSINETASEVSSSYQGDDLDPASPRSRKKRKKRFASAKKKIGQLSRRNKSSNTKENIEAGLLTNDELAQPAEYPPSATGGEEGEPGPSAHVLKKPSLKSRLMGNSRQESWKRKPEQEGQDLPSAPQPIRSTLPFPRGVHMPAPQPQMSLEPSPSSKKQAEDRIEMTTDYAASALTDLKTPQAKQKTLPMRKTSSRPEQRRFHNTADTFSVVHRADPELPRYRQWKGNNVFCFEGRLMLGPHYMQLGLTVLLIIFTWTAFYSLIGFHLEYEYLSVGATLMALSLIFLTITGLRDPGIIPRHPPSQLVESMPLEMKERMNYCPTCHIVRPPRTKHCRHCNNCIQVFDHHCPWTGNCVGARNYRFFYCFIISITASSGFVLVMSANYLTRHLTNIDSKYFNAIFKDQWKTRGGQFLSPLLIMWTLLVTILVGALLVFHMNLLCRGQTTNEYLRGEKNRGGIPHGNIFQNCFQLWCGKMPESKILPMWLKPDEEDEKRNLEAAVKAMSTLQITMEAKRETDYFDDDEESNSSADTTTQQLESEKNDKEEQKAAGDVEAAPETNPKRTWKSRVKKSPLSKRASKDTRSTFGDGPSKNPPTESKTNNEEQKAQQDMDSSHISSTTA